jgi:hypothetical protein
LALFYYVKLGTLQTELIATQNTLYSLEAEPTIALIALLEKGLALLDSLINAIVTYFSDRSNIP